MTLALAFLSILISSISIFVGLKRGGFLSPLTLFGGHCLLGIGLRAIVLNFNEIPPDTFFAVLFRVATLNREVALLELIFAQACVLAGFLAFPAAIAKRWGAGAARPFESQSGKRARTLALGLFFFSWAAFFGFVVLEFGSLSQAFLMLQKRALLFGSDVAIARKFVLVAAAALAVFTYALARMPGGMTPRRRLVWFGLVAFHVGVMFMTGSRGATLTHLLLVSFVLWSATGFRTMRLTFRKVLAAAVTGPVIAAVVIGGMAYRVSAQTGQPIEATLAQTVARAPMVLSATFPIVDLFYAAKQFSTHRGYDYGKQYLNNVTRFVPRDLWADKPETIGIQMRQYYYKDKLSAVPPTVFGEFYIALGLIALTIGSIVFGMILKIAAGLQVAARERPQFAAIYVILLMQLSFGVVKSGFENSLFTLIYFLATFLFLNIALKLLSPRAGLKPSYVQSSDAFASVRMSAKEG